MRRDYELALQVGNKEAMKAFLAQYSDGFYANLAKIQLSKLAAEETRVAATEKARLAEQERARLAAEGAQKAQQLRAEADAKAAEQARIAAEKAKQVAQEKASEAESKRVATETNVADRPSEKIASMNAGVDRASVGGASAGDKPQADKPQEDKTVVASLSAEPSQAEVAKPSPASIAKSVQTELRRVGCLTGAADGDWNTASQRSMTLFNRHAGTRLDVKLASLDALETIKLKTARVCPLVCQHGYEADGDRCTRIVCGEGSFLNDDNECERRHAKKPVATRRDRDRDRDDDDRPRMARPRSAPQQVIIRRSGGGPQQAGVSAATGQPLTGQERAVGCHSYGAIMSGVCP
jgi:hypothetical protein